MTSHEYHRTSFLLLTRVYVFSDHPDNESNVEDNQEVNIKQSLIYTEGLFINGKNITYPLLSTIR